MTNRILTNKHFRDWVRSAFPYGYGSGEGPVMDALLRFFQEMEPMDDEGYRFRYDFEALEKKLGQSVTWLMINALCSRSILKYGTSPRYGWLSDKGQILFQYLRPKSLGDVLAIIFCEEAEQELENGTGYCSRDYCNCDPGKQVKKSCDNPLF